MQPDHFDSLHLLGVILHQRGNHAQAVRQIDVALTKRPNSSVALNSRGVALKELKRFEEALASFDRALAVPAGDDVHRSRTALRRSTARRGRGGPLRPELPQRAPGNDPQRFQF